MVDGQVRLLKDRSQLKLVRSNLIVTCLTRNTQLECLNLQVAHKGGHTLRDSSEVVVVHLLVLSRIVAHQGATRQQQVRTGGIEALVYKEILLLPTEVRSDLLD